MWVGRNGDAYDIWHESKRKCPPCFSPVNKKEVAQMNLRIKNMMGIRDAELNIDPGGVLEVVGPNASGKTSIATCAQAVLARDMNPLGLSVAEAKRSYLHEDADEGFVEL